LILFFDKLNNAIGVHPTHEFEKGASKITKDKTASAISIKLFMRANNLNIEEYLGRYDYLKQTLAGIGDIIREEKLHLLIK
jgi:uncharacterized protein (DUF2252 family)